MAEDSYNRLRVRQTIATPQTADNVLGEIRYADGSSWDPGSGAGYYFWNGSSWVSMFVDGSGIYDVGGYYPGSPSSSVMMMRHVFVRSVDFPANLTGSRASAATAATAQTDFDLLKNAVSFGTMRFDAGGTTCSFIGVSATSFNVGDVLTVVSPATPDATLANIGWLLKGVRL